MELIDERQIRRRVRKPAADPIVVRNDGSRTLEIIGQLPFDRMRLMPGESLEIGASGANGATQITVYDGGLQIDYLPQPIAAPATRAPRECQRRHIPDA